MRVLRTVLVLVVAIIMVQGQPLSTSVTQNDKIVEKISSLEEPKPEVLSPLLKPEIPASDLKTESDFAPLSANSGSRNPCSSVNRDCDLKPGRVDYDQRQNGSENYRIQVDGLVLVLAPVEALLLAGGLGSEVNGQFNLTSALDQVNLKTDDEESSSISSKPELDKPNPPVHKPTFHTAPKPAEGPVSIKLINLIAPLLEQRRH